MNGQFTFLGTGGSMGTPVIGCQCPVCQSNFPLNRRTRPSGLIFINGKRFLIDCSPDFRNQALTHHIDDLDGLIITHAHHDHIAGIDELRVYYMRSQKPLPCLLSQTTADELHTRFSYIFAKGNLRYTLIPQMTLQILEGMSGEAEFEGLKIGYFTYIQGGMNVNGLRLGKFAYITDIKDYTEAIFEPLKGLDTLVLSALRMTESPMHLSINQAVELAERIGARETWFTHISHDLDHKATNSILPPNIRLAYDGLTLNFDAR